MGKIKSMLMDMSIREAEVLLKDKRTNKNYNPTIEFNKAINSGWFKEIVTRMGKEENNNKSTCIDEASTSILNKDKRSKKCH